MQASVPKGPPEHAQTPQVAALLCLLFADEVDAMLGKRGMSSEHETSLQVKTGASPRAAVVAAAEWGRGRCM